MAEINSQPPGSSEFSSRSMIKSFFPDLLRLLWWSFLCPTRLNNYLQTLHPDLTATTGLSRQLWLARRSPAVRRLLVMQLILWLAAGLLGGGLLVLATTLQGNPPSERVSLVAAAMAFSLAVGLTVSAIAGAAVGLVFGLSFVVAGSLAVGIAIALSDYMARDTVTALALVVGAFAIPIGLAGAVFDRLQRPGPALSRWRYWGRALLGVVMLAVALGVAFGLGYALTSYATEVMVVVVAGGVAGILAVMMAGGLEMLIETRRLNFRRLGWLGLDSLILALVAGGAAALAANMTGNIAPVARFAAVGIALGAAFGVMYRAGNGLSALLTAAGLTGLVLALSAKEDTTTIALVTGGMLLLGLAFYLRLPLYLGEAIWSGWLYRRVLAQPERALITLRRSPVYWDELIFFPLPRLDRLLLLLFQADRPRGLIEGGFIAGSMRQGWAATKARLAFAPTQVAGVRTPEKVAAALAELAWPADRLTAEPEADVAEAPPALPAPPNPYVGPRTFRTDEAHLFFGRELEAESLTALVASERLVLLYAQSGAGKSSLINTRLIAGLAAKGFEVLPVARVSGAPPDFAVSNLYLHNLMVSLDQAGRNPQRLAALELPHFLANLNITAQGDYFYDDSQVVLPDEVDAEEEEAAWPRCLVIDQFEELFNANIEAWPQRPAFFAGLQAALAKDPYLWVVLSLREDYLAALDPFARLLPNRMQIRYYLQRMGPEAALQAIKEPAAIARRRFAPDVAEQLVENLRRQDQFVEPVQLQIVCRDLWDKLPPDRSTIESGDLQEFGDVDQALIGFYESSLAKVLGTGSLSSAPMEDGGLPPTEEVGRPSSPLPGGTEGGQIGERALRRWFNEQLITPARTRGLVYRGEIETEGLPNRAVDSLVNSYIIRADRRGDDLWYELAHDRLIEPVLEANRLWQAAYRNPLAEAHQTWLAAGRSPDKLLSGAQLREAETYAVLYPLEITNEEKAFLADSRQQSRRVARLRNITVTAALLVIAVLAGITWWALEQAKTAALRLKDLETIIAQPEEITRKMELFQTLSPEVQRILFYAPKEVSQRIELLWGSPPEVRAILFQSQNERLVAVISELYVTMADVNRTGQTDSFLETMMAGLANIPAIPRAVGLRIEIEQWLDARQEARQGRYKDALIIYNKLINLNNKNQATRYERAMVLAVLGKNQAALADLEQVISLAHSPAYAVTGSLPVGPEFANREQMIKTVRRLITVNPELAKMFKNTPTDYPRLVQVGLAPEPTVITDTKGITMVLVPAGPFKMGSNSGGSDEQPVHQVYLDEFYIDQYEVTNAHYAAFLREQGNQEEGGVNWLNPDSSRLSGDGKAWEIAAGYDDHPVTGISWYGAKAYCAWRGGRLPTEAEWEKAARGDDQRTYPWGEAIDCHLANYGNDECGIQDTTPVGAYLAGVSPYGAYDMAGNVWEWVADWYDENYYKNSPSENPTGPKDEENKSSKVLRGGGWIYSEGYARAPGRDSAGPADQAGGIGFRCVGAAAP